MRKSLVVANWKMNNGTAETSDFLNEFLKINLNPKGEVVICPPFIGLDRLKNSLSNSSIKIGAQNLYYEENGAYTGEISASMLKSVDVSYVIIGHSERREYFNETDEICNKKVKKALEYNITPILCVGEKKEDRDNGMHLDLIKSQLYESLKSLELREDEEIVVAYEPIWAIGTGETASSEDAEEICKFIRNELEDILGDSADSTRILYGGSVKPNNIDELMQMENIDGALVGGASLVPEDFARIVNYGDKNE